MRATKRSNIDSADMAKDYWFMSTTESNDVGDLDSLMIEIPTPDNFVVFFSTDSLNAPNKLLNSITFAQVTKRNNSSDSIRVFIELCR